MRARTHIHIPIRCRVDLFTIVSSLSFSLYLPRRCDTGHAHKIRISSTNCRVLKIFPLNFFKKAYQDQRSNQSIRHRSETKRQEERH